MAEEAVTTPCNDEVSEEVLERELMEALADELEDDEDPGIHDVNGCLDVAGITEEGADVPPLVSDDENHSPLETEDSEQGNGGARDDSAGKASAGSDGEKASVSGSGNDAESSSAPGPKDAAVSESERTAGQPGESTDDTQVKEDESRIKTDEVGAADPPSKPRSSDSKYRVAYGRLAKKAHLASGGGSDSAAGSFSIAPIVAKLGRESLDGDDQEQSGEDIRIPSAFAIKNLSEYLCLHGNEYFCEQLAIQNILVEKFYFTYNVQQNVCYSFGVPTRP